MVLPFNPGWSLNKNAEQLSLAPHEWCPDCVPRIIMVEQGVFFGGLRPVPSGIALAPSLWWQREQEVEPA